jgi:CheY-like chemotaxis protein
MIVDDDSDAREALREHFTRLGCPVVVAADGLEALEALPRSPPPCVILLDLNMPRLGGEGFLQRVRGDERTSGLVVALMTAESHRPSSVRTDAQLDKPFALGDVDRIVQLHCRRGVWPPGHNG